MGCIPSKGTSYNSPRTLDRLKFENGYVKGENTGRDFNKSSRGGSEAKNVRGGGGERRISRESEGAASSKKEDAEKLFDGLPKWLTENVPKDALAGLILNTADSYDKLAKVGKGTYSNVYKARDKSSGKIVALKKVRFDTGQRESVKFMAREIIILRQLDHPNIIKLEGIATSRMQYSLYLVFDFMPSDLIKLVSRPNGKLTEPQIKSYMQQLLSGLKHCHERGILHRDIKGSNLLIDKNGVLKIADFGLANFYKNKQKRPLTSRVVTLWYRAPELLLGCTAYGVGVDLWSAGCLLAEMFVGRPIMPGSNEIEQLHKIFKLCGSPSEDYWKTVKPPAAFRPPQQYKANFKGMLPQLPDSALLLLGKLLALDPADRGTTTSALQSEFFTVSPLPCDPSGLPVISTEEDQLVPTAEGRRILHMKQPPRSREVHPRKVVFPNLIRDTTSAQKEIQMESNFPDQDTGNNLSSTTFTLKPSSSQEIPPQSPTPAFCSQHNRTAKTEAHPNALKNIKNYPLLLASLTEAAHHLEESKSSLYRRSISNIDFRNLDLEKISKLFGLEEN